MSTINRRIKVKFRDSVLKTHKANALTCDRMAFPGVTSFLTAGKECCQSVLNVKLSRSKKSELICTQKRLVKASYYDRNTPNDPAVNTTFKRRRSASARQAQVSESPIVCKAKRTLWQNCNMLLLILVTFYLISSSHSILVEEQNMAGSAEHLSLKGNANSNNTSFRSSGKSMLSNGTTGNGLGRSSVAASGYLDKLDNLERSVAAVLIKVAYGTTSTTKRSIPDNSYILGLTTVATPLLTTLRYQSSNQAQHNGARHRNYELDLERDHALPTSAPNADILKSNNNPTYPNPNRHHSNSHDRDRHRHTIQYNSTPMPSIPNLLKKANGQPTIPMYPGDIPSYSPPSRSFFTPPLPPEYQNPFADKPTLRGTNNEGLISNTVPFNNRRPIPPPSLMPGHERIPFRPPDLAASIGNTDGNSNHNGNESYSSSPADTKKPLVATSMQGAFDVAGDRKKALNTPSRPGNDAVAVEASDHNNNANYHNVQDIGVTNNGKESNANKRQEVLPNIRRILGSNGKKGDIPAVLLRHVTQRPLVNYHQPPASSIVSVDNTEIGKESSSSSSSSNSDDNGASASVSPNINKSKQQSSGKLDSNDAAPRDLLGNNASQSAVTTPSAAAAIGEAAATSFTSATTNARPTNAVAGKAADTAAGTGTGTGTRDGGAVGAAAAAAASAHTTWTWAWNIHIYLSVILYTILAVYSLYKLVTFDKLTHLFAQSYFVYIYLILIAICIMRIFYLCFDAYNIHGTFPIFAAELLLNLPSTFLTVAFAVLILFLFLKSLNHKNNRYSALVRPLTVVVGCGVHVGLCITLHYVESYTLQNHHLYFQQQQQQHYFRRQQQHQQQQLQQQLLQQQVSMSPSTSLANPPPPPRVLSLICQIIYIFICLSLGLLYLYLYRILKRILRSKSQNYIHGYQNLSYAIHITIATALLFVLLAALQIFGAVCISPARPLMSQANIVEVDWMQWGYQFSLRLIEIAIITLISWVTGLKTSVGSNANGSVAVNGDVRMVGTVPAMSGFTNAANATGSVMREKHGAAAHHHNSHSNVANFFLPCTSSSSQEQFETDYPAICNANTNLHTYTMRTGKLIYDDSYALNSLAGPSAASPSGGTEYQLQEPMYQRPYDTGSIRSAINHNITAEYGPQASRYHQHHPHHHHHNHNMRAAHEPAAYMSADYMTDATTDHYENPNFDLRTSSTGAVGGVGVGAMQKLGKNTVSSGSASASGSGSGSSGTSQQQMLLLQSDSCYSEPLQENSSYEFNNFERPVFKEKSIGSSSHPSDECWPDREREGLKLAKCCDRKPNNNSSLNAATFENPERRSSNSTNSCSSSNGIRYASYNSYERSAHYNGGVRKSGTLNNIVNGSGIGGATGAGKGSATGPGPGRAISVVPGSKRVNGAQTLAHTERSHYFQRSGRTLNTINRALASNDFELSPSVCNELTLKQQHQIKQQQQQHPQYNHNNSEEEDEEEDDDIISGSNVECTNLISNSEHGYCIASENSITSNPLCANKASAQHLHVHNNSKSTNHLHHSSQQQQEAAASSVPSSAELEPNVVSSAIVSASGSASASPSSASDSMIVAEQGFLRFRANEDVNAQHGKLQHGVMHHQNHSVSNALSQICSNVNGIDC